MTANRYRELKYFCLQYPEKVKKIMGMSYLTGRIYDGMPKGGGSSDSTADIAIEIGILKDDTTLIVQTAQQVGKCFYQELMDNVTKGVPWEYLDMPMSRRSFYRMKDDFFEEVAKRMAQK